jgi:hypothetical protein
MMLYRIKTAFNYENFEELGNAMCKQNAEFPDFAVGGTYS